jgi:hypothetical protein
VPTDIDAIFARGDRRLLSLLEYAVRSVQPDLLFVFLVREYRQHSTAPRAVALFDIFCAPQAPARVSAAEMLPPRNLQLGAAIRPLNLNLAQVQEARANGTPAPHLILPPPYLFDALDLQLRKKSSGLRAIKRNYRIRLSPVENLPGGRMDAAQTYFVGQVWERKLRPRLVAAGFRIVSTIA